MAGVLPLPTHGGVFLDDRGDERSLRVSWHPEEGPDGMVVLSLWRADVCVATFRLESTEVPSLIRALQAGVDAGTDPDLRHDRAC